MGPSSPAARSRAFVMPELLAAAVVLAAVGATLLVASSDSRRKARLAGSIENLGQIGAAGLSYATDSADRVWTFSWRAGIDYGFGGVASSDFQAAVHQAIDIMRRRSGRTDIQVISGWFPHILYSHLVLADYLEDALPAPLYISPGDCNRLAWQRDPMNLYCQLPNRPGYPSCSNNEFRWPYSSSYSLGPCFMAPDAANGEVSTIAQDPMGHRFYQTGNSNTPLGRRVLSETAFPSQKIIAFEQNQRFFGDRELFYAYDECRLPMLFVDGSVSVRNVGDSNPGFQPNNPFSPQPTRILYTPELTWETPTVNGASTEVVTGHIGWTRSGMRGRDFGGPEVLWRPP